MKNKKIITFLVVLVFLVGGIFLINNIYQNKNKINKTKRRKQNNLAIMIKEDGATEYTKSSTKDIPKGNYTLNYEKSYCKNNGVIGNYDNTLGKVSFSFVGTDSCYLYFDYEISGYMTILNNNGGKDTIEAKGTPDLNKIANTNEGMYAAQDDLGTSYYFRGAVDNNWLQYGEYTTDMYNCNYGTLSETETGNSCTKIASKGDKMYWRIIRINGDGSLRLIYSGVTQPNEETKINMTVGTSLGESEYNSYAINAEEVGYMYTIGQQQGISTDNVIKIFLDNFYINYTNLNSTESKVTDAIFCNDRTASTSGDNPYTASEYTTLTSWNSTGIEYYYGAYGRNFDAILSDLRCPSTIDKFTVNTSIGNGALKYPVGLITSDEVNFAGSIESVSNSSYFLCSSENFWTLSPSTNYNVYMIYDDGQLNDGSDNGWDLTRPNSVRPVISLSSSVKLSGDGTWNNVYTVS